MVILPRNSAADLIEQRLHGLGEGSLPSAQEIINAAGGSARLQNWAVGALRRIGANSEAALMARRAEYTSRGEGAPSGTGTRPATPEELEELFG